MLIVLYDQDNHKGSQEPPPEIFSVPDQALPFYWQTFPGERLGSVLTDVNGRFELAFEDSDFEQRELIKRPDLVLLVMAPEDTQPKKPFNIPEPSAERILHYSYDPVVNSGKNEEYIIRIPQELLNRFQISYRNLPTEATTTTVESVTANLDASFKFEQGVQATLRKQLQERLKPAIAAKKKADEAFQNFTLSKVSPEVRASATYLNPGEKIFDKLINLFDNGLIDLPSFDLGAKRKLVLHLTQEQLEAWGLIANNGSVSGEVSLAEVVEYIRDITGGGTLEYNRPVIENCLKAKEAERLFEAALAKCRADSNGESEEPEPETETPETPELTTSSLLREQITRQMKHTTPPEQELKYGVELDGEIVARIPKGPADVTAYHDFHELQIAFEHVWTEAFDKSMPTFFRSIYSEMVRYKNRVSGIDELPPVRNVRDMRSLYEDFVALQETIESVNLAPPEVTESVPLPVMQLLDGQILDEDWSNMKDSEKTELTRLVNIYKVKKQEFDDDLPNWPQEARNEWNPSWVSHKNDYQQIYQGLKAEALSIFRAAQARPRRSTQPPPAPRSRRPSTNTRLKQLMYELDQRLAEAYQFDIFAPNSVNYGLMTTYRQKWVPGNYQVGELVSTIPLAPKEIRKYTTKQVIKKSRSQKEIEDAQSTRSAESSSTSRADSEIAKQAREKTSFEANASGTVTVGVFTGEFGTRFGVESEKTSSSTKKNFREAVLKSSEEYKQQRRLEIDTSVTEEIEITNSGEIMNPNDEITVTYLFYELQRQYEISEKIHRLNPVILVANHVPYSDEIDDEIDEDWLIAHDWILRRVILDDSFLPALSYVTTSIAGDELALQTLHDNVKRQVNLVEELTKQVQTKNYLANEAFKELQQLMDVTISTPDDAAKLKDIGMAMVFGPFSLAGGGGDDEAAEKREEIAKLALERADKANQEVSVKLSREVTALQEAIDKYTRALQEHFDRQTAIARLRIHVKANLFYYMQAIWDYEPPDQRFFRLYNIEVPWIELQETTARVRATGRRVGDRDSLRFAPLDNPLYEVDLSIPITSFRQTTKKLSQVADLDNLLGYKGNYMIFPVRQASYLHTYMMQDYIDPHTGGLRDPDEFSNYTTEELLEYACCLQKDAPEVFAEHREYLLNLVKKRMTTPRKESELVVVPTGSAYIEALPGKHPILEDFKLVHRALDVKKVQAEVRNAELENVRLAARLLEGEREDPEIDKKVVFQGNNSAAIFPSDT
ncbi:MAG: hypothetical protein ACRC8A_10635 [Microcoleaceae cyanobacterium]